MIILIHNKYRVPNTTVIQYFGQVRKYQFSFMVYGNPGQKQKEVLVHGRMIKTNGRTFAFINRNLYQKFKLLYLFLNFKLKFQYEHKHIDIHIYTILIYTHYLYYPIMQEPKQKYLNFRVVVSDRIPYLNISL